MRLANPKSLLAGVVVLILPLKTMILGGHPRIIALHYFVLIAAPVAAVYCFWHAFKGKRPLLGRSEVHTSLFLGGLSLLMAVVPTLAWLGYHFRAPNVLTVVLFSAAAVFFLMEAIRERNSGSAEDSS